MNRFVVNLQNVDERQADKWAVRIIGGIFLLTLVLSCVALVSTTAQKVMAEIDAAAAAVEVQEDAPVDGGTMAAGMDDVDWGSVARVVGILICVVAAVVVVVKFWKLIFGLGAALLVVAALFWILLYRGGDVSTAEARDANMQVVKVVQPVGDPSIDTTYAEINRENAGTNAVNAGGMAIWTVLFLITFVVLVGVGVFLHYYSSKGEVK